MTEARENVRRRLLFLEEVTASSTHEIKNELAVINEQSRLMAEMLAMGRQGREPDPERIEQLIGRVIARVGRADAAVRRLNSFCHSTGGDAAGCDAARYLNLMAEMYARPAGRQDLTLKVQAPQSLTVAMYALDYEQVLWAALNAMTAAAVRGTELAVSLETSGGRAVLRVTGQLEKAPEPPPADLLEPLGAKAVAIGDGLELSLPLSGAAKED